MSVPHNHVDYFCSLQNPLYSLEMSHYKELWSRWKCELVCILMEPLQGRALLLS